MRCPCASRSASQRASLTSLFRPGTLRTVAALARSIAPSLSSTCHTGFQYTPVVSTTACVQASARNQSASASNPLVVVPKVRTSWRTAPGSVTRTQATTVFLCTSSPAHRAWITSIGPPRPKKCRRDVPDESDTLPNVLRDPKVRGDNHGYARDVGSNSETGSAHHTCDDLCAGRPFSASFPHRGSTPPGSVGTQNAQGFGRQLPLSMSSAPPFSIWLSSASQASGLIMRHRPTSSLSL